MKRHILMIAVVLSLGLTASAFAVSRTVLIVDDVIRMTQAGVGDDEIIAFVQKSRESFDISADDVIAMTDAHVSRTVIKALVDEAGVRRQNDRAADSRDAYQRGSDRTTTVYVAPRVYGYPYAYDPFYSSWYDPYWYGYGPRVYFNFGFGGRIGGGFRGGYRGGFRRGRH